MPTGLEQLQTETHGRTASVERLQDLSDQVEREFVSVLQRVENEVRDAIADQIHFWCPFCGDLDLVLRQECPRDGGLSHEGFVANVAESVWKHSDLGLRQIALEARIPFKTFPTNFEICAERVRWAWSVQQLLEDWEHLKQRPLRRGKRAALVATRRPATANS